MLDGFFSKLQWYLCQNLPFSLLSWSFFLFFFSIENGGLEILTKLRTIMSKCLVSGKLGGVINGKMCDLSSNKLFLKFETSIKHGSLRHSF